MTTGLLSEPTPAITAQPPRLLDQVAQAARQRGASEPTTTQLVTWVRAYVLFHGKRHPRGNKGDRVIVRHEVVAVAVSHCGAMTTPAVLPAVFYRDVRRW